MVQTTGQCLCGAVTISGEVGSSIQACHCRQCQRWTGGSPYFCVQVSNPVVTGAETLAAYHHSTWGERAFCATCGTTVYWTTKGDAPHSAAAGLFEDQTGWRVTEEIFVDYRAAWLPPFEGATQSTEAQEIAKLEEYLAGETG